MAAASRRAPSRDGGACVPPASADDLVHFLGATFGDSPLAHVLFDADGCLVDANRAALDLIGVGAIEEIRGVSWTADPNVLVLDFLERLTGPTFLSYVFDFDRIRESGRFPTNKSGRRIHEASIAPIRLREGERPAGYLLEARDVTDTEFVREALRVTFDRVTIGLAFYDGTGKPIRCNKAVPAMFSSNPMDPRAPRTTLFDHPHVSDEVKLRIRRGEVATFRMECDFDRPREGKGCPTAKAERGSYSIMIVPIMLAGESPTGYVGQFVDVTGEEMLSKKLTAVLDKVPVGISLLDGAGEVVGTNRALQRILGLTDEELRSGKFPSRRCVGLDGDEMLSSELPGAKIHMSGEESRDEILGIYREDGTRLWAQISAASLELPDWRYTTTVTDVTAQVEAERSLRVVMEKQKERYHLLTSLFDNNPVAIMLTDADLKVTAVNPAFHLLPGPDGADGAAGRRFCDVLRCTHALEEPDLACGKSPACTDCQLLLTLRGCLASGHPQRSRAIVQTGSPPGERRTYALTALPGELGAGSVLIAALEDYTELTQLRYQANHVNVFGGMVSRDRGMHELFETVREVAWTDAPVLVMGESGSGKEVVARAIHSLSPRATAPFVPVPCGSLPETLLESELFGHVRGAFTGAFRDKKGRFELAGGGTIFLDEIGELTPSMQVKLLRVLQEGTFERVGGEKSLRCEARVISATNRDLVREVAAHQFREDLYYRLSVVPITVPPLRERRSDIPLLADRIIADFAIRLGKPTKLISDDTMALLVAHPWPGNVRELQNALHYAMIRGKNPEILPGDLPATIRDAEPAAGPAARHRGLTAETVRKALDQAGGVRSVAAKALGVSRATFYRFLRGRG